MKVVRCLSMGWMGTEWYLFHASGTILQVPGRMEDAICHVYF